jgi:HEPN domain-containing protein
MASPLEYALLLLSKAKDDDVALQILIENRKVADEIIGFHAQQVIEKAIKSVLAYNQIVFRKTHDLAELIDIMTDNSILFPSELENAVELTPFAVEFRYDFLPLESGKIDYMKRDSLRNLVRKSLEWANSTVSGK